MSNEKLFTHDRLTERRVKIGELTSEALFSHEHVLSLLVDKFIENLKNSAEEAGKKGKSFYYFINGKNRSEFNEQFIKQLKIKARTSHLPSNLEVSVGGKEVDLTFGQPVYVAYSQDIKRGYYSTNDPIVLKKIARARESKQWDKINQNIMNAILKQYKKRGDENKEKVTYILFEDFTPEWKESLEKKLRTDLRRPGNLTITLYDRERCDINQTVLLTQLQKSLADVEVNLPRTLEQQITMLTFSSRNVLPKAAVQALNEWGKSLIMLLYKAGNDQEELEIVKKYVEETQKVIRAVESFRALNAADKSDKIHVARDTLLEALESFQEKILKLSDNATTLHLASLFLGMVVGAVIGGVMAAFVLSGAPAILLFFASVFVGMTVAHYCTSDTIGFDAVYPKQKDSISNQLTEFGIFGNTPKHKARNFVDAMREEMGLESSEVSETKKAELEFGRDAMSMHMFMPMYTY